MGKFRRTAAVAMACALALGLGACQRSNPVGGLPSMAGLMTDAELNEISGIAVSRRDPELLWAIDDSGNPPNLFAISTTGQRQATFTLEGTDKKDWEDIAAFRYEGKRYLLIADSGDNGGVRKTLWLHVVEEPASLQAPKTLKPAWSIEFRWPDGARDCEAVAVDEQAGQILLITKKRQPPHLYTLPLKPKNGRVQTAKHVGTLSGVPQATAEERVQSPARARLRSQVTAADISPDGRRIAVLTYDNLLIYERAANLTWVQAVTRAPKVRRVHLLPQPEAAAWAADGSGVYVTGEFSPAPILFFAR